MADPDNSTPPDPTTSDNDTGDQQDINQDDDTQLSGDTDLELEDEETQLDPLKKALNDERSRTGRLLKESEDRMMGGIANLLNSQSQQMTQTQQQTNHDQSNEDPEPDYDVDSKGWILWNDRQKELKQQQAQQQVSQQKQQNEQTYFAALANPEIIHSDAAIHAAVMEELKTTGHDSNTDPVTGQPNAPSVDAVLNYNKALTAVYKKQVVNSDKNPNPLKDNLIPGPGLGSSTSEGAGKATTVVNMPKNLSLASQKLIVHAGWNAEKVKKVMSGK